MVESIKLKKVFTKLEEAWEQTSTNFRDIAQENGVTLKYTSLYAIHLNRSSESLAQDLGKMPRSFRFERRLDLKLWGEEVLHANW